VIVRPRIKRHRGAVLLRLPEADRILLAALAADLGSRLDQERDDDDLRRLFPPAYLDADRDEAEYRRLMRDDLVDLRRGALDTFAGTLHQRELSEGELDAWLSALNDLRLVLGTRLDVQEDTFADRIDDRDPRAGELAIYAYLTWLQEQAVAASAIR
jgi:hypothetical protein